MYAFILVRDYGNCKLNSSNFVFSANAGILATAMFAAGIGDSIARMRESRTATVDARGMRASCTGAAVVRGRIPQSWRARCGISGEARRRNRTSQSSASRSDHRQCEGIGQGEGGAVIMMYRIH